MLMYIPLLLLPLIIYNVVAVISGEAVFSSVIFAASMPSGGLFAPTWGDLIVVIGLACLFGEIVKATRTSTTSMVDHLLSTIVFIVFLLELVLVGYCATGTFFILMVIALLDILAGFWVTVRSARRDFAIEPPGSV